MGRLIDFMAFGLLILVVALGQMRRSGDGGGGMDERRPDPRQYEPLPEPAQRGPPGVPLPDESVYDPVISIELEAKMTSTGTAFSLGAQGLWMTAKHVAEGCSRIAIMRGPGDRVFVSRAISHPRADISILETGEGAPGLGFTSAPLKIGQDGFHFGFPQGQPGAVYSTLLGRQRMRVTKSRNTTSEPVIAWIERIRDADPDQTLAGISGGPILDDEGAVVGVHVAGSIRRGRNYSVAPISIAELFEMARMSPPRDNNPPVDPRLLNPSRFAEAGRRLRNKLAVAKVICLVDDARPRRRRPRR